MPSVTAHSSNPFRIITPRKKRRAPRAFRPFKESLSSQDPIDGLQGFGFDAVNDDGGSPGTVKTARSGAENRFTEQDEEDELLLTPERKTDVVQSPDRKRKEVIEQVSELTDLPEEYIATVEEIGKKDAKNGDAIEIDFVDALGNATENDSESESEIEIDSESGLGSAEEDDFSSDLSYDSEEDSLMKRPPEEQQEIREEIAELLTRVPDLDDDYRIVDRLGTGHCCLTTV